MSDDDLDMQDDQYNDDDQDVENDAKDEMDDDEASDSEKAAIDKELAEAAAVAQSSLAARNKMRETMQSEIEAFLAKGGKIQQIDDNVMAEPPKKPTSNYGSQPI